MEDKLFVSPDQLLRDSYFLAKKILASGFQPTFVAAIWRGGTPIGIAVQEFLDYHGVKTDHIAVRTSSYFGINQASSCIKAHALDYLVEHICPEDRLLIVDDVYDRGLSMKAVIDTLRERCKNSFPRDLKIAVLYFKPKGNMTDRTPDFYVHETDKWLVFPHELKGLSLEEIKRSKGGEIAELFDENSIKKD